jgi:hypothetical protein
MNERIAELLQRGSSLEAPPASQHLTAARSDGNRTPVRNDLRMDGEWQHCRIHPEGQTCKPHRARTSPLDPHLRECLTGVFFSWLTLRMAWHTCMASGWFTETSKGYEFSISSRLHITHLRRPTNLGIKRFPSCRVVTVTLSNVDSKTGRCTHGTEDTNDVLIQSKVDRSTRLPGKVPERRVTPNVRPSGPSPRFKGAVSSRTFKTSARMFQGVFQV